MAYYNDVGPANPSIIKNKPESSKLLEAVLNFTKLNLTSFTYTPALSKYQYSDANITITYFLRSDLDTSVVITNPNNTAEELIFYGKVSNELQKELLSVKERFESNADEIIALSLINLVP